MRKRKSGLDVSPVQSMIIVGLAALGFYWVYTQNEKTHRSPASAVEASSTVTANDLPRGAQAIQSAHEAAGAVRSHDASLAQ